VEPTQTLEDHVIKMGGSSSLLACKGTNKPDLYVNNKYTKNFEIPLAQDILEKHNFYFYKKSLNNKVVAVFVNPVTFTDGVSDDVVKTQAVDGEDSNLLLFLGYYYFIHFHSTKCVSEKQLKEEYRDTISETVQQWLQWQKVPHLLFHLCPVFSHAEMNQLLKKEYTCKWCQVVTENNKEKFLTLSVDVRNISKALGIKENHQLGADETFENFLACDGHKIFLNDCSTETFNDKDANLDVAVIPPNSAASMKDLVTGCLFLNAAGFMWYLGDSLCTEVT
jgi:hypothetical protein